MQAEKIYENSARDITDESKKYQIKWVRLNFCYPLGFLYQISVNINEITVNAFEQGIY